MSMKAQVTGQFNLVDESSNVNIISFTLESLFSTLTGVQEHVFVKRQLIDTDGVVSINKGGVTTIRGFMIAVSGSGSVIVRNDSNTNGIEVTNAMLFFGNFDSITIETAATQAIEIKYVLFE